MANTIPIGIFDSTANTIPTRLQSCRGRNELNRGRRIVGGNYAKRNSHPWLVRLDVELESNEHIRCSGAIINDEWVLTAAHCCQEANEIMVYIGEHASYDENDPGEFMIKGSVFQPLFSILPIVMALESKFLCPIIVVYKLSTNNALLLIGEKKMLSNA